MTQCTPTPTLLDRIGDETSRRAVKLHDDLGLPRSCIERWVHDHAAVFRAGRCRRGLDAARAVGA